MEFNPLSPSKKPFLDVRLLNFNVLITFICAVIVASLHSDDFFGYYGLDKQLDYSNKISLYPSQVALNFTSISCIIASCFLGLSFVSLLIRTIKPHILPFLTPVATFSCLFGSLCLFFGSLGFFIDVYLHYPRWCEQYCNWDELRPKAGIFLGLAAGIGGLITSILLFTHQKSLGGVQVMPSSYNVVILIVDTFVTISACICAASTQDGWFYYSKGHAQQDWGTQTFGFSSDDDGWRVADLPDQVATEGGIALALSAIASALCGIGLVFFCSSLIHRQLWFLERLSFFMTLVGSVLLMAGAIQYRVKFQDSWWDPSPYYSFYLAIIGSVAAIFISIVGFIYRTQFPRTEARHSDHDDLVERH